MSDLVLQLTDVVKTFPGVRALDGVQLEVRAGEVHCLLGQNGAGKSTLIKVLAGAHAPDSGQIEWLGQPVSFSSPQQAMKAGIATIYQELDLVDGLSVADNIYLGHEPQRGGFVRGPRMRRGARDILARLGHPEIPVGREVGKLPAAAKQIVSMGRALSREAKLLIMDEPSAVLAHDEVANLFRVIRGLTAQGIAVIYISHRLEEVRDIGDRVTVLKDGRTTAANLDAKTTSTRELVSRMTGRTIEYVFPPRPSASSAEPPVGEPLLVVEGLERGRRRSPTSPCPSTVEKSSASPASSAPADPRYSRPSTGRAGPTPGGSRSEGTHCGGAASGPRSAPASAWRPRSARARRSCWPSRSTAT